jgi:hypothetical protein
MGPRGTLVFVFFFLTLSPFTAPLLQGKMGPTQCTGIFFVFFVSSLHVQRLAAQALLQATMGPRSLSQLVLHGTMGPHSLSQTSFL